MSKVLFVTLNTNHVLIFDSIIKSLNCDYEVLCHDRISGAKQFHTENILKNLEIPYRHFSRSIVRSENESFSVKVINFFKMKKEIYNTLEEISPSLIVLAIDNDPISQIFIKEAKKQRIKTVLIQEALIRPYEYSDERRYLSDYFYDLLRRFGIYLNYIKYGAGNCDRILVGGRIAANILKSNGIPENRITMVGLSKYDTVMERIKGLKQTVNDKKVYLYATSTKIFQDDENINFMRKLAEAAKQLDFYLIIKLHPRIPQGPDDVYKVIGDEAKEFTKVIKEGDETFELLKKADVFITVFSTIILDALLMDKECIVANYLAGESRLEYGQYDAINCIESEDEIEDVIKKTMAFRKNYGNKEHLLEDELYKLDGKAGLRAAQAIESMI